MDRIDIHQLAHDEALLGYDRPLTLCVDGAARLNQRLLGIHGVLSILRTEHTLGGPELGTYLRFALLNAADVLTHDCMCDLEELHERAVAADETKEGQ